MNPLTIFYNDDKSVIQRNENYSLSIILDAPIIMHVNQLKLKRFKDERQAKLNHKYLFGQAQRKVSINNQIANIWKLPFLTIHSSNSQLQRCPSYAKLRKGN